MTLLTKLHCTRCDKEMGWIEMYKQNTYVECDNCCVLSRFENVNN